MAAVAATMGESEFWVLILEEGKEKVSFGFKGRRSKCVRREEIGIGFSKVL